MKYQQEFSLSFYLNCGRHEDRRRRIQIAFLDQGMEDVKRFPANDPRRVKKLRGYPDATSYAYALSLRLALRKAKRLRAASVVLYHDEVALHPDFSALLERIGLPEDWGLFLLGAEHLEPTEDGGEGLARLNCSRGSHALAVRAPYYGAVMRALSWAGRPANARGATAEGRIAALQRAIPSYAPVPNLAWPAPLEIRPPERSSYDEGGWQIENKAIVLAAVQQSLKVKPWEPTASEEKPPVASGEGKAAFLFLTRGSLNQPRIWEEYFADHPGRVSIHVHPKQRDVPAPTWFREAWLPESIPTAWGDISLVRAQLALLETAYRDPANQVFVFTSESCVPVKPLEEFLEKCESAGWRGMMAFEKADAVRAYDPTKAKRYTAVPQVPPWIWKWHSQWIVLDREMAQALMEEDLTAYFAKSFAPDESYFGTVLALKGYPLDSKCLPLDPTWVSWETQPARHPGELTEVTEMEAMALRLGGHFFARKAGIHSDIAKWHLHL